MPLIYFKSVYSKYYDQIKLKEESISIFELKKLIIEKCKFVKQFNFDLEVFNQETGQIYSNQNELVAKDTRLMIKRIISAKPKPNRVATLKKLLEIKPSEKITSTEESVLLSTQISKSKLVHDYCPPLSLTSNSLNYDEELEKSDNSTTITIQDVRKCEKAKLDAILSGSMIQEPQILSEVKAFSQFDGIFPKSKMYLNLDMKNCSNCKKPGHFKSSCPEFKNMGKVGNRPKFPSGIPRTKLRQAKPQDKFVMLGPKGYVVPEIEYQAAKIIKKEKTLFLTESEEEELNKKKRETEKIAEKEILKVPDYFKCPFDDHIIKDAVVIPCCGRFIYCNYCIRDKIVRDEQIVCPYETCDQEIGSLDSITPHHQLRKEIKEYLKNRELSNKIESNHPDPFLDLLLDDTNNKENILNLNSEPSDLLSIYDGALLSNSDIKTEISNSSLSSPVSNISKISLQESQRNINTSFTAALPSPAQQIPVLTTNVYNSRLGSIYQP